MVHIIPSRLKRTLSKTNTNSTTNSRSTSPMRTAKPDASSPEGRRDTGLVLKAVVIRARDLAAKDRGGTSDPYLQLTCGETKFVSHCVPKTLNPEWNVVATIPIVGVENLLLEAVCWDKDRFGKDYMGEFDLALEEIFSSDKDEVEPRWYPLKSKKTGKKASIVSGEILLQFTIYDSSDLQATSAQTLEKLHNLARSVPETLSRSVTPTRTPVLGPRSSSKGYTSSPSPELLRSGTDNSQDDDEDYDEDVLDDDETPEDEDPNQPEAIEKRKRRLRIKGLKKKKRQNPYEFTNSGGDVVGLVFLEISSITDLPPESNFTKTSFDMDPFVVASLGKKTYRTKVVRHNLNPVFNEKMLFQVLSHEQSYSFAFTVIDRDKYSGNDFIASTSFPLQEIADKSPKADPKTGLYDLKDPPEYTPLKKSRLAKIGMSRSPSSQSLNKSRPPLYKNASSMSQPDAAGSVAANPDPSLLTAEQLPVLNAGGNETGETATDDPDFVPFTVPLKMKNLDKWEAKHNPQLFIRAKYMPYPALRQQFWRAMLKQYDTDESGEISKVELTTMLDTLGSTLRESTINSFFQRFPHKATPGEDSSNLTIDEAIICLEDQLEQKSKSQTFGEKVKGALPDAGKVKDMLFVPGQPSGSGTSTPSETPGEEGSFTLSSQDSTIQGEHPSTSNIVVPDLNTPGEEGDGLERDDLNVNKGEEHVVEIRECPICHQPRLNKRKDTDIITHIATCASQDWRQVNSIMMGGFVTASQAQRKWYSKIITKISYGGYKLGANSANILVQDRLTGQINEEKMSVYVRLGIRLLYKGLKSKDMEKKRIRKLLKSLSIKQGKKYDDPASREEIPGFVKFHNLNMNEVLLPMEAFKNFNEFFYRALKPGARPCSAPDDPNIFVSPADCRSVVFNSVDSATSIWVKGREFSIRRLLGDAYGEYAPRFEKGAFGIFRLAPQDYHRFHIPVDGVMGQPKIIEGEYYTVNPMAIRSALDVYGENVRVVVPIDTPNHGRVMVICVGAMMVGSTVITRKEGEQVRRAEELGYFKFGGSTIVLLFEEGKMVFDDDLVDNSISALETLVSVGMSIGHSPNTPQWAPDMRKDPNDVTEEDKQEADRRIRGGGEGTQTLP